MVKRETLRALSTESTWLEERKKEGEKSSGAKAKGSMVVFYTLALRPLREGPNVKEQWLYLDHCPDKEANLDLVQIERIPTPPRHNEGGVLRRPPTGTF